MLLVVVVEAVTDDLACRSTQLNVRVKLPAAVFRAVRLTPPPPTLNASYLQALGVMSDVGQMAMMYTPPPFGESA